MFTWRSSTGNF